MASSSTSAPPALSINSDKRPKLPSLQTPVSASYPSEMRSPLPGTPSYLKKEEVIKTPITPPLAYLDFLKSISTGLASPATGTSAKFHFNDKGSSESFEGAQEKSATPPTPEPPLSRTNSAGSESSSKSVASAPTDSEQSIASTYIDSKSKTKPQSPRIVIPPSPFAKPRSAKLPRGIHIPPSPMSPANLRTPMSARSQYEPQSASALSGTPWSATYSPTDPEANGKMSKVSVKQIVTRTVTYSRTPLDPAPKGKRRKLED